MRDFYKGFPPQQLSFTSKGKKWRKACIDWASDQATITYNPVRNSTMICLMASCICRTLNS